MELFENLKLDKWFKAVTYLGCVILVLAAFVPAQVATNTELFLLGTGLFLLGIGRWKNRKSITSLQDMGWRGMLKMSGERRKPDITGMFLEIVGIILLIYVFLNVSGVPMHEWR